jgi:hypothetical protein
MCRGKHDNPTLQQVLATFYAIPEILAQNTQKHSSFEKTSMFKHSYRMTFPDFEMRKTQMRFPLFCNVAIRQFYVSSL